MKDRHLEIYEHLRALQDYMTEYYWVALSQGKENELERHLDRVRKQVKEFIWFRDSLYRG